MNRFLFAVIGMFAAAIFATSVYMIFRSSGQEGDPPRTLVSTSTDTVVKTPQPSSDAYTLAEIGKHNNASSCYAAINGFVYDLTSWISQHPGGPDKILNICGTDGSAAFNGQHGGERRPANELAGFKIGTLAQ
jgi:cytochrome b involved in lipid metabolism